MLIGYPRPARAERVCPPAPGHAAGMSRRRSLHALLIAMLALGVVVTGALAAGERKTRDRRALKAVQQRQDRSDRAPDRLADPRMTLEEKLNQLTLLSDGQMKEHPEEARKPVGAVFSETDPVLINKYQHDAVENSRLHIPILFAFDTIHGFRTIFPIPLGTASSFDPNVAQTDHRIGAFESAAVGLKQIYSPMVDLSHEPRWGRISEASGEDPYLNSVMAAARVKGAQGNDYSAPDKVVTSVKHYAAYGEPDAGRDYNTTDMSLQRLWNFYLPPFKAAVDAGADTAMCAFNALNGVPACANRYTETKILKQRWGFDGFIESDYTAVAELRAVPGREPGGRPVRPRRGRGRQGGGAPGAERRDRLRDGLDQLPRLRQAARAERRRLDAPHRRRGAPHPAREVPRRACSSNPYVDVGRGAGQAAAARRTARRPAGRAGRSMVLLKNDGARAAARPDEVHGDHRAARRRAGTTCSAPGGAAATTTTRCRCSRA